MANAIHSTNATSKLTMTYLRGTCSFAAIAIRYTELSFTKEQAHRLERLTLLGVRVR